MPPDPVTALARKWWEECWSRGVLVNITLRHAIDEIRRLRKDIEHNAEVYRSCQHADTARIEKLQADLAAYRAVVRKLIEVLERLRSDSLVQQTRKET